MNYNLIKKEFLDTISKGLNEKEKEQLEAKIKADPEVVKHYKKRTMLKDVKSGKLLPASSFAFSVEYPIRGFKALTRK
ncbi:hypothetical protein [Formosa algae]|uniref:hypothetical protein n=1 Tax=Formosa algae TaxID=225843 RepID=UPI000CCEFA79|nr:hypothetical protein [Formosa algae]PNW28933.1 hypothetical protein BKP44_06745 [Formosa algae]